MIRGQNDGVGRLKDITDEVETLPVEQQAEVLDFIAFLKKKQAAQQKADSVLRTPKEIESFFRSFPVDISGYHFDREEANAR